MNLNRRSRHEDALFVIALIVPALFAAARYFESDRQMDQIAQAHAQTTLVASAKRAPAQVIVAQAQVGGR
jgi:hypothetical protein